MAIFGTDERDQAVEWLSSFPERAGVAVQSNTESDTVVVEISQSLRAQDFDMLAKTVSDWLDAHPEAPGLVVHARTFPGWKNIAGMVQHARFVRGYRRKLRRVAVVTDSRTVVVVRPVVNRFAGPEIDGFRYDDLQAAIAWAGRRAEHEQQGQKDLSSRPD